MTEEEAKTKICCGPWMVASLRGAEVAVSVGNRPIESTGMCIASACMAWRGRQIPVYAMSGTADANAPHRIEVDGYCGLAGASR